MLKLRTAPKEISKHLIYLLDDLFGENEETSPVDLNAEKLQQDELQSARIEEKFGSPAFGSGYHALHKNLTIIGVEPGGDKRYPQIFHWKGALREAKDIQNFIFEVIIMPCYEDVALGAVGFKAGEGREILQCQLESLG